MKRNKKKSALILKEKPSRPSPKGLACANLLARVERLAGRTQSPYITQLHVHWSCCHGLGPRVAMAGKTSKSLPNARFVQAQEMLRDLNIFFLAAFSCRYTKNRRMALREKKTLIMQTFAQSLWQKHIKDFRQLIYNQQDTTVCGFHDFYNRKIQVRFINIWQKYIFIYMYVD